MANNEGDMKAFHVHTKHTTVLQFKRVLRGRLAIPMHELQLVFNGERLIDERLLASYELTDGAWLSAVRVAASE